MSAKSTPLTIIMGCKETLYALLFLLVIFTHRVTPSTLPVQIRAEQKPEPWEALQPHLLSWLDASVLQVRHLAGPLWTICDAFAPAVPSAWKILPQSCQLILIFLGTITWPPRHESNKVLNPSAPGTAPSAVADQGLRLTLVTLCKTWH